MSIGLYEQCTGINWGRYADIIGIGATVITWIFGYSVWMGVVVFFMGLLMTLWETSFIYKCIGPCMKVHQFFMETLLLKKPVVRTILYFGFAIITFVRITPCIGAGIVLLVAAIVNILAQMNQMSDAADEQRSERRSATKESLVGDNVA